MIGGFTPPAGSRLHLGALLLGAYAAGGLHFVGKVGTGFSTKTLAALARRFCRPQSRATSPFVDPPREKGARWLAPKLVAQIAFQEWTADRKLRQPVFLGLRDDKKPAEVRMPGEPLDAKRAKRSTLNGSRRSVTVTDYSSGCRPSSRRPRASRRPRP